MKAHVNLSLDSELWSEFKAECSKRKLVAGHEIEKFIAKLLEKWQKEETNEKASVADSALHPGV